MSITKINYKDFIKTKELIGIPNVQTKLLHFAFSPDSNQLIYFDSQKLNLYNFQTKENKVLSKITNDIQDTMDTIKKIEYSADNQRIGILFEGNKELYIYNLANEKFLHNFSAEEFSFSPNGQMIALTYKGMTKVINKDLIDLYLKLDDVVHSLVWSKDSTKLAAIISKMEGYIFK